MKIQLTILKKIKLVESLNINTNYNIFSDSLKIRRYKNLSMRTRLFDLVDINMGSRYFSIYCKFK